MISIEHHINELKDYSTNLNNNEEAFLYSNLTLSLLYLLIDCPEQAFESFDYVLKNIKKIKLISIQFGITHIAIISKIFNLKYGAYHKLNKQLTTILSNLLNNVTIETLNVDSLNGHFSVARYLLNNSQNEEVNLQFFQKNKKIFLEDNFSKFNKSNSDLNEYEIAEFPMGYLDLGVPHGIAGTLFFLVDYYDTSEDEEAVVAIRKVISKLFDAYYHNEKPIIKGFLSNDKKVTVQDIKLKSEFFSWCYGTLGIANALNYSKRFLSTQEEYNLNTVLKYLEKKDITFNLENHCFCHGSWGALLIKKELDILNNTDKNLLEQLSTQNKSYSKVEEDSDIFSHIDGIASEIICQYMLENSYKLSQDEKSLLKQLLLI